MLRPPVTGRDRGFGQAPQPLERDRVGGAFGICRLLQADAGLDGEDHLCHLFRRVRRRLVRPPVHIGDDLGQALPGAGVQRRVPPAQLRVPRCVHAELDQQQPPVELGAVAAGRVLAQHPHPLRAGQALGQPRVLRRPLGDPLLQQGQEQVGLVAEPGLHHAPGEPRLVGDLIQRGGVIAAGQEDPPGGSQDQSAVALVPFGTAQTFHTSFI